MTIAGPRLAGPTVAPARDLRPFEGHLNVEVRQDGTTEPLGSSSVTGSGAPLPGPFHRQIEFAPPIGQYGAMVFTTNNAENNQVWQIAAYRIRFS